MALVAGKTVLFSTGLSYGYREDYDVVGIFIALKNLSMSDLKEKCIPFQKDDHSDKVGHVVNMLISEGYVKEVDYTELDLGGGGEIDPRIL